MIDRAQQVRDLDEIGRAARTIHPYGTVERPAQAQFIERLPSPTRGRSRRSARDARADRPFGDSAKYTPGRVRAEQPSTMLVGRLRQS